MPTTLTDDSLTNPSNVEVTQAIANQDWLLRNRLKRVEETWAEVLEEECGAALVALLTRLRRLCAPDGQANAADASPVLKLIEALELSDAIKMARAFALYFQLSSSNTALPTKMLPLPDKPPDRLPDKPPDRLPDKPPPKRPRRVTAIPTRVI
jgi:hypothetical protein